MVLVAARVCAFTETQCSSSALQLSWSRCIAILLHYKEHIPSAPYAVQVLETLRERAGAGAGNVGGKITLYPLIFFSFCGWVANDAIVVGITVLNEANPLEIGGVAEGSLQDFNPDWVYPLPGDFADFDFNWMGQASI